MYISRVSTKEVMSAVGGGTVPQVGRLLVSVAQRFEIVFSEKYLASPNDTRCGRNWRSKY